jgi:hypothetical protein
VDLVCWCLLLACTSAYGLLGFSLPIPSLLTSTAVAMSFCSIRCFQPRAVVRGSYFGSTPTDWSGDI